MRSSHNWRRMIVPTFAAEPSQPTVPGNPTVIRERRPAQVCAWSQSCRRCPATSTKSPLQQLVELLPETMKLSGFLLVLSVSCCAARGSELGVGGEADGVNASDSSNLTQILENWRSSIMAEVKDLLLHHHHAVLPDYSRIPPMSQSLENLKREFGEIKGDVDGLKVTFSSFGDLLGKLGSARNVSHTSELRATFKGFKDLLKKLRSGRKLPHKPGGMDRQPRRKGIIVRRRKPVTNTGLGTRTHTRKYLQGPRLRLPAGRVQRNFSPHKPVRRS